MTDSENRHAQPRILVYVAYAALAAFVLGPLLKPGFVLTLDMVFTPQLRMPDTVTSSYLFHAALRLLNFVLPGDVIEKIVLFAIFFAAGVGMHLLVRSLLRSGHGAYDTFGAYFAGVCYVVNPFTYDRLMAGQYSVLLGYALVPFFAKTLLVFLRTPTWRLSICMALEATAISIASIHTVGIIVVLTIIGLGGICIGQRDKKLADIWKLTAGAIAIFVILSSYWLVPLALGKGATATEIDSFGRGDVSAFATTGWGMPGRISNVAHLQGFWAENRGLYTLPQVRLGGLWNELSILLLAIIIVGMVWAWRAHRRLALGFFAAGMVVGGVLALGALTPFAGHFRLLAGYREPQKFEMLVTLGYCVFIGLGAAAILRQVRKSMQSRIYANGTASVLMAVPLIFTSTLPWGGRGQLAARAYPADWVTANKLLDADTAAFQTLFLPWHAYMYFNFAGRIVSNPAPMFFDRLVIVSDNPEFDGAAPLQPTATKRSLDQLLPNAAHGTALGQQLAKLHIKYILLDRDDDYQKYDYLDHQSDLRKVFAGSTLLVYENEDFR